MGKILKEGGHGMKRFLPGVISFLLCALFGVVSAHGYEETVMQNFLVQEGVLVSVSNIQGRVSVEGHGENVVNMVATKSVEGVSEERAREMLSRVAVRTEVNEEGVRITTDLSGTFLNSLFTWRSPRVDYQLAVPFTSRVEVETVSGEVNITDLRNVTEARTVSGKISVRGAGGKLNLETVSGKVVVGRLLGDLVLRTISGNVELEIPLGDAFIEAQISSVSGGVLLFLSGEEGVKLSVETVSGRFSSDIPLEIEEGGSPGRRTFEAKIGEEVRKTIFIKTISGNVSVKKSGRVAI